MHPDYYSSGSENFSGSGDSLATTNSRMSPTKLHKLIVTFAILGWYVSSSLLIGSNKVLFDLLNVDIPLLITFIHFSLIAFGLVALKAKFPNLIGETQVSSSVFVRSILPLAALTVGDVGLSNMAYSRLPISVMTVIKSSAPVCIYIAGVLMGVEKFRVRTSLICFVIAVSVASAVPARNKEDSDAHYEYISGVVMVSLAVLCTSMRWVFVQRITRFFTPMQLLYLTQPVSALILLPFALIIDCDAAMAHLSASGSFLLPTALILGSAVAAMGVLISEYKIVHATTSLTLAIAGIGKEILTLCLSVVCFSESFTFRQIVAVCVSIVGILMYAIFRSTEKAREMEESKYLSSIQVVVKELGEDIENSPSSTLSSTRVNSVDFAKSSLRE